MPYPNGTSRLSFLQQFRDLIQDMEECEDRELRDSLRLDETKIRVPIPVLPLQILLGGEDGYRLNLYPELVFDEHGRMQRTGDYLLFEPIEYFSGLSGFLRLTPGEAVTLGRDSPVQRLLLKYPKLVDARHLRLKLTPKGLALKNKSPTHGACVAPLTSDDLVQRMVSWRLKKFERLREILGGPIEPPSKSEALDLIERVTAVLDAEPYRVPNDSGCISGLLALPDGPRPIFVGDLHAHLDNLLVLLTQNGFLEAIEDGSAALILMGDAVHSDVDGEEAEMESSMLMMDLIFRLKLRLPDRVFYLRGNHDSFSEDVSKAGVPQGLMWEKALRDKRGARYLHAMEALYDRLPYVAVSRRYLACHAGPPSCPLSESELANIEGNHKLAYELTHVRLRRAGAPTGYARADVARMRKTLGLDPEIPLVVGHTPLSEDDTYWWEAGGIPNHHVVFGANAKWIGVITSMGKQLLPLRYPVEPLLQVYNRFARTGRFVEAPREPVQETVTPA
jgi:hypothetical protein